MAIQRASMHRKTLLLPSLLLLASILTAVHSTPVNAGDNSLAGLLCTRGNDWISPHWLTTSKSACASAIQELAVNEVQGLPDVLHDFGPEDIAPVPGVPAVQTPYKIQRGIPATPSYFPLFDVCMWVKRGTDMGI